MVTTWAENWLSLYKDSLRVGRSGDRIPVGARFSAPVQIITGGHPASCTVGAGSFPGEKRPGRGVDNPPPSEPSWHVLEWTLPLLFTFYGYYIVIECFYRSRKKLFILYMLSSSVVFELPLFQCFNDKWCAGIKYVAGSLFQFRTMTKFTLFQINININTFHTKYKYSTVNGSIFA